MACAGGGDEDSVRVGPCTAQPANRMGKGRKSLILIVLAIAFMAESQFTPRFGRLDQPGKRRDSLHPGQAEGRPDRRAAFPQSGTLEYYRHTLPSRNSTSVPF